MVPDVPGGGGSGGENGGESCGDDRFNSRLTMPALAGLASHLLITAHWSVGTQTSFPLGTRAEPAVTWRRGPSAPASSANTRNPLSVP